MYKIYLMDEILDFLAQLLHFFEILEEFWKHYSKAFEKGLRYFRDILRIFKENLERLQCKAAVE